MKFSFSLLLIFFCYSLNTYSLQTNFNIIDSLVTINIKNIYEKCIDNGIDTILYTINSNGNSSNSSLFLEKKLLTYKKNYTLINSDIIVNKQINKYIKIKINNENISVTFNKIENNKNLLIRKCINNINVIKNDYNGISENFDFNLNYIDTVNFSDINIINSSNIDFATATVPLRSESFFKRILEPTLVILTTAITIFLFFSVRSNK